MRFFTLASVLALCTGIVSGTTLVAVWSPTQVLLAADSSVTTDLSGITSHSLACKIGQQKSTFFAFSGLVDDRATGYRADRLAEQAMKQGGSVEERVNRFLEVTREPLARSVALLKKESRDRYDFLQDGHPVLQAIFAFAEPGPPSLVVAGFELDADGAVSPFVNMVARGDDGRGPRIIYAGHQTRIREYLHDHRDWYTRTQSDLVRSLIELEEAGSGGEVGGPVDIVKLTPSGSEWIDRKPQCQ